MATLEESREFAPSTTERIGKSKQIRIYIREIALTIFFSSFALILYAILKRVGFSKLLGSSIAFIVAALVVFLLFPKVLGIPFGRTDTKEWTRKIGLYPPQSVWKHILLGILLAMCTLSGMLMTSIMTGKYVFDMGNINSSQMVFSLIPGVFEELFIRGVLMIILLRITKSLEKAFVIQIVVFGLMHINGIDAVSLVDALSVSIIAISFTYVAYKTRSLLAAIVFHYLHDAFLFLVQLPGGVYQGFSDNALFYAGLWIMVGVSILITKMATERFRIQAKAPLYEESYSQPM
jgi:membrane protease YdiL (CAAX protease family)